MNFGKWKDQVYAAVSQAASSKNEECLRWISELENATEVEQLRESELFTATDRKIAQLLQGKLHGLCATQCHALRIDYLSQTKWAL